MISSARHHDLSTYVRLRHHALCDLNLKQIFTPYRADEVDSKILDSPPRLVLLYLERYSSRFGEVANGDNFEQILHGDHQMLKEHLFRFRSMKRNHRQHMNNISMC
ncbi:unnamed protein product [Amoebophrya sp. A120]|nr:unnamed protein product [Amoebophrya sp. A120]|eukprot:GSA120T00003611001.1